MLVMDLTVILDEMASESLGFLGHDSKNYRFPQSKIEKLSKFIRNNYQWSANGCLELIAVRNALTHNNGKWNSESIKIIAKFVSPAPDEGDLLIVGFPMLFRYRKAIRTFLNEVQHGSRSGTARPTQPQRATPKRLRKS